ncbi:MAG: hypothetical protein ABR592_05330 [Nitriliruptorales bacterium]
MATDRREPEEAPDDYSASQEEIARHSLDTGGDAPAAASLAQREALAREEEPFFERDEDVAFPEEA